MKFLIYLSLLIAIPVQAKLKVAIIDSGLDKDYTTNLRACDSGHFDFTRNEEKIGEDNIGHGTKIAYLIKEYSKNNNNYCILVYKIFTFRHLGSTPPADAINMAIKNDANILNISFDGLTFDANEYIALKKASDKGIIIFAAAGNKAKNLDENCNNYPTCYKGIKNLFIVGAMDTLGKRARYSNYGKIVNFYEDGSFNNEAGTSYAVPRIIGKFLSWIKR